jgi:hypothetical protein
MIMSAVNANASQLLSEAPAKMPAQTPAKTPPVERRRGYRARVESSAVLRPMHGGESKVVHVFDLSTIGVGFSTAQDFALGEVYRFAMTDRRQAGSRVEIASRRERADGMFDVGATFC